MNTPKQVLQNTREEFEKKFPPIKCSAHERTSSAKCICEELPDINEENSNFKSFLTSTLQSFIEAEIAFLEGKKINSGVGSNCDDNYDKAIDDQIYHLKELLTNK